MPTEIDLTRIQIIKIDPEREKEVVHVSEALDIDRILEYSGIDDLGKRTGIAVDGLYSYENILTLWEPDIIHISKGFSYSTFDADKLSFGLRQTNLLKATIKCYKCFRVSAGPLHLSASTTLPNFALLLKRQGRGPGSGSIA